MDRAEQAFNNYKLKKQIMKSHGLIGSIIFLIILIISIIFLITFIILKYKDKKHAGIYIAFIVLFSITLVISFLAMFGFFAMYREND